MKTKQDSSAWTIEVANQLRLNSPRYKKTMELIKAYRFDDYFNIDFEQSYDYQAKSEEDYDRVTNMSAFEILRLIVGKNHNVLHDYVMWRHYHMYLDEFVQDVHEFDSLKTPKIEVDGSRVDADVTRQIEDTLLEEVTPNNIQEFTLTLFPAFSKRFKGELNDEFKLSGYILTDCMEDYGLPDVIELAGWVSPREKERQLIEKRKAEAEARIAKDKAEATRVLVASQKKSISDRLIMKFTKHSYAIYSAFAKAREQWTSKTNRQNQLLKFELTIQREVSKINAEIMHDMQKFVNSEDDTNVSSLLQTWNSTLTQIESAVVSIQALAENVVKDHEFVTFDEFMTKIG